MPTPREAFSNSVQREGYSGARHQAADFGAAGEILGRAAQGFGQQLGKVADDLDKIQLEEDKVLAQAALNISSQSAQARLYDGPGGFFNKQNADAVEDHKVVWGDIETSDKDAGKALARRPRAFRMYQETVLQRNMDLRKAASVHAGREWGKYTDIVTDEGILTNIQAAASATDVKVQDNHIASAGNLAEEKAVRHGIRDPNALANTRLAAQGKAILGVVSKMEADGDPVAATQFLEAKRADMPQGLYNEQRGRLGPLTRRFESNDDLAEHLFEPAGTRTPQEGNYYPDDLAPTDAPTPTADVAPSREIPINPAAGFAVNSGYGPRTRPKTSGGYGSANHEGIDSNTPSGTPVKAMMSGWVKASEKQGGYGNIVELDHGNGLTSFSAHLSSSKVKVGQRINQGDVIALSGASGNVSGPHLHFETRQNGQSVDPKKIFGRQLAVGRGGPQPAANVGGGEAARAERSEADIRASIASAGYTPMKEEAMYEALDRHLARQNRAEAADQESIETAVASWLNSLGDPDTFTNLDDMPSAMRMRLGAHPKLELFYRKQASSNQQTIEARRKSDDREAKGELAEEADGDMAALMLYKPDDFMKMDFTKQIPGLTRGDRIRYDAAKLEMIQKRDKPGSLVPDFGAMRTAITSKVVRSGGMTAEEAEKDPQRVEKLYQKAVAWEQGFIKQHGKLPNPGEREAAAIHLTMPVTVAGEHRPIPRGELNGRVGKAEERAVARTVLMREGRGQPPSEVQITNWLERARRAGVL